MRAFRGISPMRMNPLRHTHDPHIWAKLIKKGESNTRPWALDLRRQLNSLVGTWAFNCTKQAYSKDGILGEWFFKVMHYFYFYFGKRRAESHVINYDTFFWGKTLIKILKSASAPTSYHISSCLEKWFCTKSGPTSLDLINNMAVLTCFIFILVEVLTLSQ